MAQSTGSNSGSLLPSIAPLHQLLHIREVPRLSQIYYDVGCPGLHKLVEIVGARHGHRALDLGWVAPYFDTPFVQDLAFVLIFFGWAKSVPDVGVLCRQF